MEDVLVSVWCTTYNHELYIRDAIESFLTQKTTFQYEIIIHDDASTDRTSDIIREYEQKYPDLIHGIYQIENQYSIYHPDSNWIQNIAIQNCKGKYIAVCEGDDYWIDDQKLELQVQYLESHPGCIMTGHNAAILDCRNYKISLGNMYSENCNVKAGDIISQKSSIFWASMVYRREVLQMKDFFLESGIMDYPYLLYSFTLGDIYYFNNVMSVYRRYHEESWSHSISNKTVWYMHNIRMIEFLRRYNEYTEYKYEKYVIARIQKSAVRCIESSNEMDKEELFKMSRKCESEIGEESLIILKQLDRLKQLVNDKNYICGEIQLISKKYKRIVVMGTGVYAGILARQLLCQNIEYEGFVVSDNQQVADLYLEKPVWRLSDIPFDLKETGIFIGINPIIWDQIIDSLNEVGIENYICPFILDFIA